MRGEQLIGVTAAELMEILGNQQADPNAEVTEVCVCVLVNSRPPDDPSNLGYGYVIWRFSDPVRSHQLGLVQSMQEAFAKQRVDFEREVEEGGDQPDPEDD